MKRIAVLNSDVEAQTLQTLLRGKEIPHVMRTYHDSAYDGLFQGVRGWGHVEAPEAYQEEILALLESLRA